MIKLDNISKYYSSNQNIVLGLRNINLEFKKGEFVAITGESGSGKSTLLNVIGGLDTYEDGELYFDNKPTSHYDQSDWEEYRKTKIGFIFQSYNLIESYSVLDNVLSALVIQGYPLDESRKKAEAIIEKVGLTDRKNNRASQLSSGQKQRLSIARALAKETDVIMADEPTGNLDVENGKQIIELLYEISKEKLVIIVTHNFDEVEEYATRKIRMHDGEVELDVEFKKTEIIEDKVNKVVQEYHENVKKHKKKKSDKTPYFFAKLNMKTQPRKALLVLVFFLFTSIASYIFLGGFLSNLDDTATKKFDTNAFLNSNNKRISVRKSDGGDMTDKDILKLSNIKRVTNVEEYDLANDIVYTFKKNVDYKEVYHTKEYDDDQPNELDVILLKKDKFMMSQSALSESDITKGRLPKDYNEVVVSSNDKSLVGKTIKFYYTNPKKWSLDAYVTTKMKVVGLTNKEKDQVYFSNEFIAMMASCSYQKQEVTTLFVTPDDNMFKYDTIVTLNNELKSKSIRLSKKIAKNISFDLDNSRGLVVVGNIYDLENKNYIDIQVDDKSNDNSKFSIEISKDIYEKLFASKSKQAAVYIEDYAYSDEIVKNIIDMGYDAVSPFKLGSLEYDKESVRERLMSLMIAFVSLVVIMFLEVIIVKALLKYKKGDFVIFKLIGMNNKTVNKINYIELLVYDSIAIIVGVLLIKTLCLNNVVYVQNICKYYKLYYYVIYILLNFGVTTLLAHSYNRYLAKNFSVTSLTNF